VFAIKDDRWLIWCDWLILKRGYWKKNIKEMELIGDERKEEAGRD
jgi:hypothetical protein